MSIRSYYYFNENFGDTIYDYFDKNNLKLKNKEYLENWKNNSYLFTSENNNYFSKELKYSYLGSFTIILKLKILDLDKLKDNTKYLIFDSSNNNLNYGFGIFLKKENNNYSYHFKLDNLDIDYQYYEIHRFNKINNDNHSIVIKWNEDSMDIDCYFFENIENINNINKTKKNFSYNPYNKFYQGSLPSNDGLEIYSINLNLLSIGGGILKNKDFINFFGNIKLFLIDTHLFSDLEIFNMIKFNKKTNLDYFFNGSNYFENTNSYMLRDITSINNINFSYNDLNNPKFLKLNLKELLESNNLINGWVKYDYTDTNQFNSYLFSNKLNDYFIHTLNKSNYYSYSFTIWTKGKKIQNEASILSFTIPSNYLKYKFITMDLVIKVTNKGYSYYLDISAKDKELNTIENYYKRNLVGTINKSFKWDHICICYNNTNDSNLNFGLIKTYLNKNIINEFEPNLKLPLKKNTKIYLGLNSKKTNKFIGFISGIQIFNKFIDQSTVDRTFDDLENCYHPDTKILTKDGYVKIKNLKRGELIYTYNNGYQKLARLIVTPTKKQYDDYILFKKGCFGSNKPNENLIITKGHPVFYKNNFYNPEDFVNSLEFDVELINLNIHKVYHLQFEDHNIINSNNIFTTSLPSNTNYLNLFLPKDLYFDKEKYNEENIGKHYPPYFLHNDPIPLGKLDF